MRRLIFSLFIALISFGMPLAGQDSQRAAIRPVATVGGNGFNRMEGFPFEVGLAARSEGPNPFQGRGVLILRTDAAEGLDQVGYSFRAEKLFLGPKRVAVGAMLYSEGRAIESRGVGLLENSLSGLIFHTDYRDYHGRQGFATYATYAPRNSPLSGGIEFRTESHDLVTASDPGSVFDSKDPWRHQSLVADGKVHSIGATVRYDEGGGQRGNGGSGWNIEASLTQGLGGDLDFAEVGIVQPDGTRGPPVTGLPTIEATFTQGSLDVRRYTALGNALFNLRLAAEGVLTNEVLPPQFQHALGGAGTLPGLPSLQEDPADMMPAMDCGARDFLVSTSSTNFFTTRFFPFYGCDRYVLFQAQLEGYFGFQFSDIDLDLRDDGLDLNLELIPRWVVFFDAAQAWVQGDVGPFPRFDEELKYDAGGGIAFGDLGFYVAIPLQGVEKDPQFVVRLGSRF
jgi:hypothetical protein